MWKKSIAFIGRYIAIGVLVGIGIYAVDEVHWRLFGSERLESLQQNMESLRETYQKLQDDLAFSIVEAGQSETLPANETIEDPFPFRPAPYFVNGELQGYRLYPGSDRMEFMSLGLRPGDLLTEIDGQPMNDPADAFELFEKALNGQPVQFSIVRDDELEQIEIRLD
ncbi:MAG: PDZ domain-containing protein [Woeseiaceae bacterium]|nr:PDZ domain-containing protein [Woeseiaceae bacterium]